MRNIDFKKIMQDRKLPKWFYLLLMIPIIWLALLVAPSISGGLPQIVLDFPKVINNPVLILLVNSFLSRIPCKYALTSSSFVQS